MRLLKWLPSFIAACLVAMMQVGPSEAEINFCKWIHLVSSAAEEKCLAVPHLDAITWAVAIVLVLATILLVFLGWVWKSKRLREPSELELVFPKEANLDSTESLFKRSWTPFPSGHGLERRVSFNRFFIGVRNKSTNKTLRGVRLVIESLNLPPQVLNLPCVCDRTKTQSADIPPGGMDYFLVGEGVDGSEGGKFHPNVISKDEYDALLANVDKQSHIGFELHSIDGRAYSLLKNDGYVLEITAYADDVSAVPAKIKLNTKERIELLLED